MINLLITNFDPRNYRVPWKCETLLSRHNWRQLKMVNMHFKIFIIGQSHVNIPAEIIMPVFVSKIG